MIKISTIPNITTYLQEVCDFSPILARKVAATLNMYCVDATSIFTVYNKLNSTIEDVLHVLNTMPIKGNKLAKEYGYDDKNELITVLDTFTITTEPDEILIEEEFVDEDEVERKVWELHDYSLWVDNKQNATHITLFKNKRKIGALSTSGSYTNQDGKWLKISLAEIQKSYRGMGLGKRLYQILLQYSSPQYVGIASHLPDRYNMKEVPAIYDKLSGFIEGDWAYIPKHNVNIKESVMSEYQKYRVVSDGDEVFFVDRASTSALSQAKNYIKKNGGELYIQSTKPKPFPRWEKINLQESKENNFIKTLRILQEGKVESDKCPECNTKLSVWTNKKWQKYKKCEKCNYTDGIPLKEGKVDEDAFYKEGQRDGKAGKPKNPKHSQTTTGGFAYLSGYADATGEDFPPNKNKGKQLKEAVSSLHTILKKGDEVFWEHDPDGIPSDVLDEIDSDTVMDTTAILKKANGDIWISTDIHPMTDAATWVLYHKADRVGNNRVTGSNYEGDDYVAQRLRDRRG